MTSSPKEFPTMRVLVTGASGVVGAHLVPQLVARGHEVVGTTRSRERLDRIRYLGAEPVVLDGLDRTAVIETVRRTSPDAIIHEMSALKGNPDLRHFDRWFARTNALRTEGTSNLLEGARQAGVGRFLTQSYTGWNNARSGGPVKSEDDPLDPEPAPMQRETLAAQRAMERAVLDAPLEGVVLRYANLYGPDASDANVEVLRKRMFPIIGAGAGIWSWLHVEDAAIGTADALERATPGIYNLADDDPAAVAEWLPYLAQVVGAPKPLRVPVWLGRLLAGQAAVQWLTAGRGSSNAKARRELGWSPTRPSWRDGFRELAPDHKTVRRSSHAVG
jgi:nucleoside-diphosphate-sugar epimerase